MPYLVAFVGLVVTVVAAGFFGQRHLGQYMRWQHRATRGLGYFGLTRAEKAEFKADMLRRSRLANLVMAVTALPRGVGTVCRRPSSMKACVSLTLRSPS